MKVLSIIESAYRATIEEQDDTVVWLMHALKGAGAAIDVLLRGDAVNYAVRGQDASGLAFGGWRQTEPPRIEQQLGSLTAKGVTVYALADDLAERGLARWTCCPASSHCSRRRWPSWCRATTACGTGRRGPRTPRRHISVDNNNVRC